MDKIAIAISTRNRDKSYFRTLQTIRYMADRYHKDAVFSIFTVDDASNPKYCVSDYRFNERSGISAVKNRCLQLCYESGADHIFLFDDDTYPIAEDWWLPYIESGLEHAMYCFGPGRESKGYKSHNVPNGCMLYFTRKCIGTIGGFDTNYNNKYEHADLSRRIFNAGLTPAPYIDVIGSDKLIYCMDQDNSIQRSFTEKEMQYNLKSGYDYFMSQATSKSYIEFMTW